jgi:hypothetical protein
MTFQVVWKNLALQQLAAIWMVSDRRTKINEDCESADRLLSQDGHTHGDDYFGDRYVILSVLWILYRVDMMNKIITILQVGRPGHELPHENSY